MLRRRLCYKADAAVLRVPAGKVLCLAHGTISVLPAGEEERKGWQEEEGGGKRLTNGLLSFNVTQSAASQFIPVVAFKDSISFLWSLIYSGGELKDVLDLLSQRLLSFPPSLIFHLT